jgi:hypothetical protein
MTTRTDNDPELVPIDEVARRLGMRASAIRYYEERGRDSCWLELEPRVG